MPTAITMLVATMLLSCNAEARGSYGSTTDAKVMIAIAFLIGIAAIGSLIRKHYPGIPQMIGGIFVLLMVGQFGAIVLAAIGLISNSAIPWATITLAVAIPFAVAWWSGRQRK